MSRKRPPPDPRGGHIRLYWELHDSVAWRALSWAERGIYVAIRRKLLSTNNGNVEATLGSLKHSGVTSSATLAKALRSLTVAGFIGKTRQGGIAWGRRVCSLYRFTDEPVLSNPKLGITAMHATHDYRRFDKIAQVRAALRDAHDRARRPGDNDEPPGLRSVNRSSSKTERKAAVNDSIDEQEAAAQVHKLNQAALG